jgi:hypothetical protein
MPVRDGSIEVLAQRRVVLADPTDGVSECTGDVDAGPFRRTGPPSAAEADGARQLTDEEVTFSLGVDKASAIAEQPRVFDVLGWRPWGRRR